MYPVFLILVDIPDEINFKPSREYNFKAQGSNTDVEIREEEGIVIKKKKPITDRECDIMNLTNSFCVKDEGLQKSTVVDIVFYTQIFYYLWKSVKLRKELSSVSPYFSKTYDLSEEDYSWKEELVKFSYSEIENINKEKIKKQLIEIDKLLQEKKIYLTDMSYSNLRITESGDIKIIDGELLTLKELNFFKFLKIPAVGKNNKNMRNIYFNSDNDLYKQL